MRPKTRSTVPLEMDDRGHRIRKHGHGGYSRGCGCDVCEAGHTQYNRERDNSGDQILTHGLSGWKRGHRCEACVAAYEADRDARRGTGSAASRKMPEGEARKSWGTPLSGPENDTVNRAAAKMGLTPAAYRREACLLQAADDLDMTDEELAALDTTRRYAPRQPGRPQREEQGQ